VLLQTGLISQDEKKKLAEYRGFKPFLLQVRGQRGQTDVRQRMTTARVMAGVGVAIALRPFGGGQGEGRVR
jgi:hypothetical protein